MLNSPLIQLLTVQLNLWSFKYFDPEISKVTTATTKIYHNNKNNNNNDDDYDADADTL